MRCFSAVAGLAVAVGALNGVVHSVLLVCSSTLTPPRSLAVSVALTRWAIASHVSRIIFFCDKLLRSGSSRAIAAVAAWWRILLCAFLARHALHVCVPSSPDGRVCKKVEK